MIHAAFRAVNANAEPLRCRLPLKLSRKRAFTDVRRLRSGTHCVATIECRAAM